MDTTGTDLTAGGVVSISSSAFVHGGAIPRRHTCDGVDVSPELAWGSLPSGVRSLALIVDDPDAPRGTFTHWVVYGLSPSLRGIPEGALPKGAHQGVNDFRRTAWSGPCPPGGRSHRYFFRLYALDAEITGLHQPSRTQLLHALEGHVLGTGELMGTYGREA
jgi:Raf kinase inhibitor-like YbhB/YbcL family protein